MLNDNLQLLLSIYSHESFLKYQDCQWIYSVRFCITKLKMVASYIQFLKINIPDTG